MNETNHDQADSNPGDSTSDAALRELKSIIDRLRSPGGCPWDLEQTPATLKPFLLEEAHEVAEAIDQEDPQALCEELGDLLMNIFLQARIGEEEETFSLGDIAQGISDKLVRRHPHVFGDGDASTSDEVRKRWDQIKADEKGEEKPASVLRKLPASLPALSKAMRYGKMAAEIGFDWPDRQGPLDKVREELHEVEAALEENPAAAAGTAGAAGGRVEQEVGDLLFAITSLCRHTQVDPERALIGALARFESRFHHVESAAPAEASLEELERLWEEAKGREE